MNAPTPSTLLLVGIIALSLVAGFQTSRFLSEDSVEQQEVQDLTPNYDHKTIIDQRRPLFALKDLKGNTREVSEWDGKILVVNFWATWCPPCRDEIPEFVHLQSEYEQQGVQFLGVALQTAEEVVPFYEENAMNYPSLVGLQDVQKVAKAYGNLTGALPYTAIIDQNGFVKFTKLGPLDTETARKQIDSLL